MNLLWLTSVSRVFSRRGACIKGHNGVTSTKTQKYFVHVLLRVSCGSILLSMLLLCHIHKSENELREGSEPSKGNKEQKAETLLLCNDPSNSTVLKYHNLMTQLSTCQYSRARDTKQHPGQIKWQTPCTS